MGVGGIPGARTSTYCRVKQVMNSGGAASFPETMSGEKLQAYLHQQAAQWKLALRGQEHQKWQKWQKGPLHNVSTTNLLVWVHCCSCLHG